VNRVAVLGCGGSGKTTLARRLGAALGAPVIHLDTIYYDAAWNPLPQDVFAAAQRGLVAAPRWVIDGNYAATLPIRLAAADTVIFLDLPAPACLLGIARRRLRREHHRVNGEFLRYVWRYRRTMAARVRALIAAHAGDADVHIVRSRRAANRIGPYGPASV